MKRMMHFALASLVALALSPSAHASFFAAKGKVEPPISSPKLSIPQAVPQSAAAVATHPGVASAQKSAAEAQHHLEQALKAHNITKANVIKIQETGKKIEHTAGDIKSIYGKEEEVKVKAEESKEATPEEQDFYKALQPKNNEETAKRYLFNVLVQVIFAVVYFFLVVKNYPMLSVARGGAPDEIPASAKELQASNEVSSACHASFKNIVLSWCCPGARAAHTFYSALGFNYWAGCLLTSFFPCLTLWYFNTFTNLNKNLGGEKRNPVMGLLCSCCCSCCVITQDAETLDHITDFQNTLKGIGRAVRS